MPPNILSGESSGGKHFKLVLEVTPPNVHVVPNVDVGGATGGDAEFKWGGREANVGRGVSISGCDGLQWGPWREPDAVV